MKYIGRTKLTAENLYVLKGLTVQEESLTEKSDFFLTSLGLVIFLTFSYAFVFGGGTIIRSGRIQDYSFYMISTEEALSDVIYAKFEKKSRWGSLDKVILTFRDSKEIKIYYNIQWLFEILDKYDVIIEGR
ncbi:hypothetical protein [Leptospira andrefontaineae]|uniref:Uncharacterized protein n=1 Tax=Leptospira andrefontaineae TaxID=2484976 RepID=A0A4R9H7R4_9LEPT|nr:hypothetical protein [Leptospira andrefontaineae]TGK41525.1 hypothetical protein EHO65_08890 [Leptospira andrefontaineae]